MRKGVGMVDVMDSTRPRRPPEQSKDFSALVQPGNVGQSSVLSLQQSSAASADPSSISRAASKEGDETEKGSSLVDKGEGEGVHEQVQGGGESKDEELQKDSSTPSIPSSTTTPLALDFPFCCERNWCSHTFLLPPGEYILSAYSEEFLGNTPGVKGGMVVSKIPSTKTKHREATGETPREIFKDDVGVTRGVWAHVTSTGAFGLSALSVADMEENADVLASTPLVEMKENGLPLTEVWPFVADHQQEVGSKGLVDVITRVRREVDELNLQILELKYGNTVSYDMDDD